MPNLSDSLIASFGSGFDKAAEESMNSAFLNQKGTWISKAVGDFIKYNTAPNTTLGNIAKNASLNGEQVKRLAEEVNVQIYLQKYASVKQKDTRYVEFPLADATQIIDSLAPASPSNEKLASLGASIMEKVASTTSSLNFLSNSESYEPSLWDADKISLAHREYTKRNIMNKTAAIAREQELLVGETFNKLASFGDSMIQIALRGNDAQGIFNKIACEVDLDDRTQHLFQISVEEKLASLIENRYIPKNFNFELQLAELNPTESTYSLGKHSLLTKLAQDTIVEIKGANLSDGRSYESLAQLATEIKNNLNNPILRDGTPVEIAGGHVLKNVPKEG